MSEYGSVLTKKRLIYAIIALGFFFVFVNNKIVYSANNRWT